jgi:NADH-quinone oxidoreductase subunit J
MKINLLLLVLMVLFALRSVMARSLLKAVIALAFASAALTVVMFRLSSPIAAVFELSVCTGLITAIFISAIALTKPLNHCEIMEMTKGRIKRYWYLPVILAICAIALSRMSLPVDFRIPVISSGDSVGIVLWNIRQLDMLGQVVVLLAGIFGIVVLLKEVRKK